MSKPAFLTLKCGCSSFLGYPSPPRNDVQTILLDPNMRVAKSFLPPKMGENGCPSKVFLYRHFPGSPKRRGHVFLQQIPRGHHLLAVLFPLEMGVGQNRYPKWSPGQWKKRLKPAVLWWFNFDPHPMCISWARCWVKSFAGSRSCQPTANELRSHRGLSQYRGRTPQNGARLLFGFLQPKNVASKLRAFQKILPSPSLSPFPSPTTRPPRFRPPDRNGSVLSP